MVYLRELEAGDIEIINRWRTDRDISRGLAGVTRFVNLDVDREWYHRYLGSRSTQVRLAIIDEATATIVGVTYLLDIDWVTRSAEYASFIGKKELWGKGYGTAAARLAIGHAFRDLNLHRIWVKVLSDNERALRMYRTLGLSEEGVLRQAAYKNGSYHDLTVLSLIRDDFLPRQQTADMSP